MAAAAADRDPAPAADDPLIAVRVQPRASRDQVLGDREGVIAIALKAPPVDGQANAALLAFVARQLAVPRRAVLLVRGATSRSKWIRVEGWSADAVRRQLLGERACGPPPSASDSPQP